jgi:DNA polymerase-1
VPISIPPYTLVSSRRDLTSALAALKAGEYGLDFETTALRPSEGRVRLVSLHSNRGSYLVDFDRMRGGFAGAAGLFVGRGQPIVFNAGFEQRWFDAATGGPAAGKVVCWDVGNLRRAVLGGGAFSLKKIVEYDLKIEMDKTEQASNWDANELTQEQLDYAFLDAYLTWKLWLHWHAEADIKHMKAFHIFNDMVPAVIEMEESGIRLDVMAHAALVAIWEKHKALRIKRIRKLVPKEEVENINSNAQWGDYFAARMPDDWIAAWPRTEKTGHLSMTIETLRRLAGFSTGTPLGKLFTALHEYKTITKYVSSFGETLIGIAERAPASRIHASYNIGYAITGRFSSSGPNLQQTPRDRDLLGDATSIRSSFVAPKGRKLVSLDYSGIELRVLALLSGDGQLLQDMIDGDVHAEVAAFIAGRPIDKTKARDKALRQSAKGVSFGIVYGIGAHGLGVAMGATPDAAQTYIDRWEKRYPQAFGYRYEMMDEATSSRFIRCADGGTIYMGKKPELPKCANYNVQRAALSIMARAIARHKLTLDAERVVRRQRSTKLISTIHDALIDETADRDARKCLRLMEADMIAGYTDIFPGAPTARLVEGGIGQDWGHLEG